MRTSFLTIVLGTGLAAWVPLSALAETCAADAKEANLAFVVEDINGEDVRLGDYKGQVILLDFWATWCAPCRIEIPGFIELYDKYAPRGFVVIGFDVDDPAPAIRSFAAELGMDYPVLVGADRDDVMEAYGPPVGFPTSFIIDREGKICFSHTGFAPQETFEREIQALL